MALVKLALVLAPRLHLGDDSHASGSSVGLLDYVGYIVCNRANNKCNDGCVCCVYCVCVYCTACTTTLSERLLSYWC